MKLIDKPGIKKYLDFMNSVLDNRVVENRIIKGLLLCATWMFCLIPCWLFIGVWNLIDPVTVLEKLATIMGIMGSLFFMGGFQAVFIGLGAYITVSIFEV